MRCDEVSKVLRGKWDTHLCIGGKRQMAGLFPFGILSLRYGGVDEIQNC